MRIVANYATIEHLGLKSWGDISCGADIAGSFAFATNGDNSYVVFEPGDVEVVIYEHRVIPAHLTPRQQEQYAVLLLCEPFTTILGVGHRRRSSAMLDGGYSSGIKPV
jgi:hypothetical protein